jgi:hypothetical protein
MMITNPDALMILVRQRQQEMIKEASGWRRRFGPGRHRRRA